MAAVARFLCALALSCGLIFLDLHLGAFAGARAQMSLLLAPFRFAAGLPGRAADGVRDYFSRRQVLVDERDELRLLLAQEKVRLRSLDFFAKQNDELRAKLGLAARGGSWLAADVIASAAHPHSGRIHLNKGVDDGITAGMAVVNNDGIIGQIVRADADASVVRLLSDENQSIAARLRRNNLLLVLRGDGEGGMTAENISRTADVVVGDELIADGGLFPVGHPIGVITDKVAGVPHDRAEVAAAADFWSDRVVLIYLGDDL